MAVTDEQQWYYASGKDKKGPVNLGEVKTLIQADVIDRNTLVWADGMADWAPANDVLPDDVKPPSWRQPPDLSAERRQNLQPQYLSAGTAADHPSGMIESVGVVFSKYATFSGRARRPEYWYFVLFNFLVGLALVVADIIIFGVQNELSPLNSLYSLAVLIPSLAVGARRLHDIGRSGWWQLIVLIPIVGIIVLIVWCASRGDDTPNRYGPS